MKRTLQISLLALMLLAGFSCKKTPAPVVETPHVETGDLLFVGIPVDYGDDSMAQAIAEQLLKHLW